jgi:hypothetical protein
MYPYEYRQIKNISENSLFLCDVTVSRVVHIYELTQKIGKVACSIPDDVIAIFQ